MNANTRVVFVSILLLLLLFWLVLPSCNPIAKAKQRVLTNERAFNEVGQKWATLNPCNTDSPTVIYLEGETVEIPKPVVDFERMQAVADSIKALYRADTTCDNVIDAAYQAGYDNASADWKAKPSKLRVDTVIKRLPPDTRTINSLQTRLNDSTNALAANRGHLAAVTDQAKTYKRWLAYGVVLAILLGVVIGKLLPSLALPKLKLPKF